MDLWVKASPEDAKRVIAALKRFGAPMDEVSESDFEAQGIVFQIGVPPRRIDILTTITAVGFDEAQERCLTTEVEGQTIMVIGREDFIRNKRAVGRPKCSIS